jgi:hypothetical protein
MRYLKFTFVGAVIGTLIPWAVAAWKVLELYRADDIHNWHSPTMGAFMFTILCAPAGAFLGVAVALDTRPDPSKSPTNPPA